MAKNEGNTNGRQARDRRARSVQFPEGTLADAVTNHNLMDVEVMEALGVGSSTWFRWKRTDRVPVNQLYNVSTLLGLPEPASDDDVPRTPWFVMRTLENLDARIARLEQHLAEGDRGRRRAPSK